MIFDPVEPSDLRLLALCRSPTTMILLVVSVVASLFVFVFGVTAQCPDDMSKLKTPVSQSARLYACAYVLPNHLRRTHKFFLDAEPLGPLSRLSLAASTASKGTEAGRACRRTGRTVRRFRTTTRHRYKSCAKILLVSCHRYLTCRRFVTKPRRQAAPQPEPLPPFISFRFCDHVLSRRMSRRVVGPSSNVRECGPFFSFVDGHHLLGFDISQTKVDG